MNETTSFAALIGIDWSDRHHDIALRQTGSRELERTRLEHSPEALSEWLGALRHRFGGRRVGIALETSRGPLVHALLEYEFVVIHPINPRSLHRFREAFSPSGAKDDAPDAELLLEMLIKHRDRLDAWEPDDLETRTLRRLVEVRRKTVNQASKFAQQLGAALKEYFPQALDLLGDLKTPLACDFLLKWPTLQAAQRARPQTLRKFFYGHNCRRGDLIEERIRKIQQARPLTNDTAVLETSTFLVQMLVRQLKALGPSLNELEEQIRQRFENHEDAELFSCLPGSGAALAPRLLVAFGARRERFSSADDVQKISGIAPVTVRSGQSSWVHWRWSSSKFLRQTFHEFAHHSIRFSKWARAFYEIQRERGKDHHAACRALAFKWIRILWRCWQDRRAYDEAKYIRALERRGSPVAQRMAAAAS